MYHKKYSTLILVYVKLLALMYKIMLTIDIPKWLVTFQKGRPKSDFGIFFFSKGQPKGIPKLPD